MWELGIGSVKYLRIYWLWRQELNLRPLGYEAKVDFGLGWREIGYSASRIEMRNGCAG